MVQTLQLDRREACVRGCGVLLSLPAGGAWVAADPESVAREKDDPPSVVPKLTLNLCDPLVDGRLVSEISDPARIPLPGVCLMTAPCIDCVKAWAPLCAAPCVEPPSLNPRLLRPSSLLKRLAKPWKLLLGLRPSVSLASQDSFRLTLPAFLAPRVD